MTKIQKLRKHLANGKSITQSQAWDWWKYQRLGDGIYRLRKEMNINTEMRKGKDCMYAVYKLDA